MVVVWSANHFYYNGELFSCLLCSSLEAIFCHRQSRWLTLVNQYKGHVLLQKTYVSNFFTGKRTNNGGELPKYLIEGHHEAIINSGELPTF